MIMDVLSGQLDTPVSVFSSDGQRAIGADCHHGPGLPVAYRLSCGCEQGPVIAAGDHDVADERIFAAGDSGEGLRVEVSSGEASALHRLVDRVDVVVGRGDDGDGVALLAAFDPRLGDGAEMVAEAAGDDAIVGFVRIEGAGVAGAQLQRRDCFPLVTEAVDALKLLDAPVGAQLANRPPRPMACSWR
jgi:hypothetical protein